MKDRKSQKRVLRKAVVPRKKHRLCSMPERPFKFKITKDLIGRIIEVGFVDGPSDVGIVVETGENGRGIHGLGYWIPGKSGIYKIDSSEQIIRVGEKVCVNL